MLGGRVQRPSINPGESRASKPGSQGASSSVRYFLVIDRRFIFMPPELGNLPSQSIDEACQKIREWKKAIFAQCQRKWLTDHPELFRRDDGLPLLANPID